MNLTLDIKPEVQAELARQAAVLGRPVEAIAVALLEGAVNPTSAQSLPEAESARPEHRTGQALIDGFAEVRGLLTDGEIDRMFRRNPSTARPVDLS